MKGARRWLPALAACAAAQRTRVALRGSSVAADAAALEAASLAAAVIVADACDVASGEAAASAFLDAHLDWRWDGAGLYAAEACPQIHLRLQPPRLAAVLRHLARVQFPRERGGCDSVHVARSYSGTYVGNRLFSMATTFLIVALSKRRGPHLPWGLPEFLSDESACGDAGGRRGDLGCFFQRASSCDRPFNATSGAFLYGDCTRDGGGRWKCAPFDVGRRTKVRGRPRFPPPCRKNHEAVAFYAAAMRPNTRTRLELRRRARAWLADKPEWRATLGDGASCAVLHVRHGDKYTRAFAPRPGARAPPNASLGDYVDAARSHAPAATSYLVLTDDADVAAAMPAVAEAKAVALVAVAPGRPLVSLVAVTRDGVLDAVDCEKDHVRHRARCATGGFNYRLHPATGEAVGSEELYQFLVAFTLAAHCGLTVGMGHRSYFSSLLFGMMCANGGKCPRRVDIHDPATIADDGTCHYLDRADDAPVDLETWRTQDLPPVAYILQ